MCQENQCSCPLCGGYFYLDGGFSTVEHLAKGILEVFKEMQNKEKRERHALNPLPCPRCGVYRMSPNVLRNALSRHADVHICDICGVDEAVRVYSDSVLPIEEWWVISEIMSYENRKEDIP